jgi:uncharacterized repeat protein (TIGR01451 family)
VLSLLSARAALSAVTVNINSGNPRYPFPQFLAYAAGLQSLAQQNPEGVPHAEMEQWTRDAWQIYANEFIYTGTTVGGVQYIKANVGCPYDCTEGDGYALLAAAYMGDKQTFDGIWMRFHDVRLNYRPRYQDGVVPNAAYLYGNNPKDNTDSAADGDFDAAMGILMAYYQWGANSGITISGGGTMNYQTEAVYAIDALVAKYRHFPVGDCRITSGDIGLDGYFKGGNTWDEMTAWANGASPDCPEFGGAQIQYADYAAPAYFNCFGSFLQAQGYASNSWDVTQFQKATASSDWIMGQHIGSSAQAIPYAGHVSVAGSTATLSNVGQGEDFRFGWRTILNYLWNGNPTTGWDPVNHVTTGTGNTFEKSAGQRFAAFLKDPQGAPWNNACQTYGGAPGGLTFFGPATVNWSYSTLGIGGGSFNLNWLMGTGSPAAVASQDFDLMAKLFRQCTIEWDVSSAGDNYLSSVPVYFHGFFRWLGMDILTGNHPDPCDLVAPGGTPPANLKIYKSVDRTYAFNGDTITYWLNYRNYASTASTGTQVQDALPPELGFVSASPAPSSAPAVGGNGTVSWSLPSVPGLVNQNYGATMGGITLVAMVLGTTGRFCNQATISCSNGSGWTSNEFPNHQTPVMERNCVDIVPQVMSLTKTASPATACAGDKVTFTLNYMDNGGAWLNGGRPNVVVSMANQGVSASSNQLLLKFRLMHAADEPYIDYGNYRISYFMNDTTNLPGSWGLNNTIYEGGTAGSVVVTQQALPPGPTWNQRLIVQFAPQLAGPAIHLFNYTGLTQRIHKGGTYTLRAVWQLHNAAWSNVNWSDDWSADPLANDPAGDSGLYYPITDDWTAGNSTSVPVTKWDTESCQTASHTVNNVLVEEWDGYTWRRAFGNGPVAGRQLTNMSITDVLPACMTFGGFIGTPAGVTATAVGQTVTFSKANVNITESGALQFWVTMGSCGGPVQNTATMAAAGEKPVSSSVTINPGAACGGTPTNTPSVTATPTRSATATLSATPSLTPSGTPTRTPSATLSLTASPSLTASSTQSRTATGTPSASPSGTPSPTPSATRSQTPSGTPSATPTLSPSPVSSPTFTPTATPTATRSATPTLTASPSVTSSATPSSTRTASPSLSPTPTASPTRTPTPSFTVTFLDTYTVSPTISPTPSSTRTASPSATPSASPSATPSVTATGTASVTRSASPSATPSSTVSPIASATNSPTVTPTATVSPVFTLTVTGTATPSATATGTSTATRSATPSATGTPSRTASPSASPTSTATASQTPGPSPTASDTQTVTPSATPSATPTRTVTATPSYSSTRTATPTLTPSITWTASPTVSLTRTISPTFTISPSFTASPTKLTNFYQQPELVKDRGIYPNPFSDRARIYFTLRVASEVKLTIYNVAGEPIFVRSYTEAANKREILWEGINEAGGRCASGVYILRLDAQGDDGTTGYYWATMAIQR